MVPAGPAIKQAGRSSPLFGVRSSGELPIALYALKADSSKATRIQLWLQHGTLSSRLIALGIIDTQPQHGTLSSRIFTLSIINTQPPHGTLSSCLIPKLLD
jgi:hypothetical protein